MDWISVKDHPPEYEQRVLVVHSLTNFVLACTYKKYIEEWKDCGWEGDDEYYFHHRYVKYWMPLPKAPTEEKIDVLPREEKQDACPKCLDSMKVIIGERQKTQICRGSQIINLYKCPECGHEWRCRFIKDEL